MLDGLTISMAMSGTMSQTATLGHPAVKRPPSMRDERNIRPALEVLGLINAEDHLAEDPSEPMCARTNGPRTNEQRCYLDFTCTHDFLHQFAVTTS